MQTVSMRNVFFSSDVAAADPREIPINMLTFPKDGGGFIGAWLFVRTYFVFAAFLLAVYVVRLVIPLRVVGPASVSPPSK
jgi:hypothetical protein